MRSCFPRGILLSPFGFLERPTPTGISRPEPCHPRQFEISHSEGLSIVRHRKAFVKLESEALAYGLLLKRN